MVEHTTYMNNLRTYGDPLTSSVVTPFLNGVLSAYPWESDSAVTVGSSANTTYGKYYFTENSYIKIYSKMHNEYYWYTKIDIVTPNGTITTADPTSEFTTFSVGKTDKGICICAYSGASGSRANPRFYNLYVGDITTLDGQTTKGCIYVNDDNSYIVATDKGISEESAFVANINNTKKAYLAPATDSTNGGIFKDIYMMFSSPVQYNKMKIADTGTKYLCGKAMCLAD